MSPGVPVPSKGALRALRHLALGTSCTVAFTTGLLTEDRRRRIHAAREVQENGRRIKSSRNYHGAAGAAAVATLEDQVLNHPPFYSSAEHGSAAASTPPWRDGMPSKRSIKGEQLRGTAESLQSPPTGKEIGVDYKRSRTTRQTQPLASAYHIDSPIPIRKIGDRQSRQRMLASDIMEVLQVDDSIGSIETATAIFFEAFQNRLHIGKAPGRPEAQLAKRLVTACGQIFDACQKQNCIGAYIPIIQKILSLGPIEEDLFYELHAPEAIAHLLGSKTHRQAGDEEYLHVLNVASSMYLAEFSAKSSATTNSQMRGLGILLCAKAMKAQLYKLTDSVYWRMSAIPSEEPPSCVNLLILANHKMGYHKNVLSYFRRFFVLTEPSKLEFDEVVEAALDSCTQRKGLGWAEDVIRTSAEMARSGGFKIRVAWPMKVLGQHWRTTRDLASTRVLFDRLEAFVDCIDLPQALYSAIIQFCIEDGNDEQAHKYLDKHISANGTGAANVRTCGHFALSKAMKEDWEGVENSFLAMKPLLLDGKVKAEHSQIFTPILKLFSKSHGARETEQFIKKFMDEYGVVPNMYASNIMVDKYAEAKEMDSIPRWLETVRPLGLKANSVTFNAMLSSCRDEWRIPFTDLLHLCRKMERVDDKVLDECTIPILREAAIRETRGDRFAFVRFSNQIKLLRPGREENGLDFWPSMREAMAKGSPRKTLRIYNSALRRKDAHIPPDMFALAMQAAIELGDDSGADTPIQLLRGGKKRGIEISSGMARMLMHQLEDRTLSNGDLRYILEKNTILFESQGLNIPMGVATKVASIFSRRGLNHDAISLWKYYAEQNGLSQASVDISSLTILLRIHLAMEHAEGVLWVMETLCQNDITPTREFMLIMKTGLQDAKLRMHNHHCTQSDWDFCDLLEDSLANIRSQRTQHVEECKEVGAKMLDIMADAVADFNRPKTEAISDTGHLSDPCITNYDSVDVDVRGQQKQKSVGRHFGDAPCSESNASMPFVRKVVSVTQLDRRSSGQKKQNSAGTWFDETPYSDSPSLPVVENVFATSYDPFEMDSGQRTQDAMRAVSGGPVPIRRLVSNY